MAQKNCSRNMKGMTSLFPRGSHCSWVQISVGLVRVRVLLMPQESESVRMKEQNMTDGATTGIRCLMTGFSIFIKGAEQLRVQTSEGEHA